MKKTLTTISIIILIILFKLVFYFSLNELIIKRYNSGNYDKTLIKALYILNIDQPYIVHYNDGNISYRRNEFKEAIHKYESALEHRVPKKRVCDVRINLVIAKVNAIETDNPKEKKKLLVEARNILYKNDCAHENDNNGKSADAEKLEEEIRKLEEELNQPDNPNDPDKPDDPEKPDENDPNKEKEIEEKLREQERRNREERNKERGRDEEMNGYEYYPGIPW